MALFSDLGADELVVRICPLRDSFLAQGDRPVSVRQATLLNLNGHHECQALSRHIVLLDHFGQLFQLHFDNACDQMQAIVLLLVRQQCILNRFPMIIACECPEEGWLAKRHVRQPKSPQSSQPCTSRSLHAMHATGLLFQSAPLRSSHP